MAREFRKEKISRKALDDLARRYSDPSASTAFPYTLESGERIQVCGLKLLSGTGSLELKYLLGQTYPYHSPDVQEKGYFPVTDLIFDKDRKPWSRNPKDGTALLMLSAQSKLVMMVNSKRGPVVGYSKTIPAIIHREDGSISEDTRDTLELVKITKEMFQHISSNFEAFYQIATEKQKIQFMELTDKLCGTSDAFKALERLYIEQTSED